MDDPLVLVKTHALTISPKAWQFLVEKIETWNNGNSRRFRRPRVPITELMIAMEDLDLESELE